MPTDPRPERRAALRAAIVDDVVALQAEWMARRSTISILGDLANVDGSAAGMLGLVSEIGTEDLFAYWNGVVRAGFRTHACLFPRKHARECRVHRSRRPAQFEAGARAAPVPTDTHLLERPGRLLQARNGTPRRRWVRGVEPAAHGDPASRAGFVDIRVPTDPGGQQVTAPGLTTFEREDVGLAAVPHVDEALPATGIGKDREACSVSSPRVTTPGCRPDRSRSRGSRSRRLRRRQGPPRPAWSPGRPSRCLGWDGRVTPMDHLCAGIVQWAEATGDRRGADHRGQSEREHAPCALYIEVSHPDPLHQGHHPRVPRCGRPHRRPGPRPRVHWNRGDRPADG